MLAELCVSVQAATNRHPHAHTTTVLLPCARTCPAASPRSARADQPVAGAPHADTQRHQQKQGRSQARCDAPAHAPVQADSHGHVPTDAHMHNGPRAHAGFAGVLGRSVTAVRPARALHIHPAGGSSHAGARALLQPRRRGTHALARAACSHSLTFHRDLSNGFYDSQTGHGHTRVVG